MSHSALNIAQFRETARIDPAAASLGDSTLAGLSKYPPNDYGFYPDDEH